MTTSDKAARTSTASGKEASTRSSRVRIARSATTGRFLAPKGGGYQGAQDRRGRKPPTTASATSRGATR
ncbi:hypothetical protein J3A74_006385 [Rhodococcus sp. PvP104]|nr:hypothetical protein [Rhodococcus sp. PvP104]